MFKLKDFKTGAAFDCIAVLNAELFNDVPFVAENADKIADIVKAQVEAQGCTDFRREGNYCYFGTQSFRLPTIRQWREGVLTFRSKDYVFTFRCPKTGIESTSYGPKPKSADITEYGFILETPQGRIRYNLTKKGE